MFRSSDAFARALKRLRREARCAAAPQTSVMRRDLGWSSAPPPPPPPQASLEERVSRAQAWASSPRWCRARHASSLQTASSAVSTMQLRAPSRLMPDCAVRTSTSTFGVSPFCRRSRKHRGWCRLEGCGCTARCRWCSAGRCCRRCAACSLRRAAAQPAPCPQRRGLLPPARRRTPPPQRLRGPCRRWGRARSLR